MAYVIRRLQDGRNGISKVIEIVDNGWYPLLLWLYVSMEGRQWGALWQKLGGLLPIT